MTVEQQVVYLHGLGLTQAQIAGEVGRSQRGVGLILRRQGEETRRRGPARRYELNEQFFEVIDTEAKAYWLGFITADGYVSTAARVVAVNLGTQDAEHLRTLARDIATTLPVRFYANDATGVATLRLHSAALVRSLGRLGLDNHKSTSAKAWDGPQALMPHYWRGVFDGDGCIHLGHRNSPQMTLVGTEPLIEAYAYWVRQRVDTRAWVGFSPPAPYMRKFVLTGRRVCATLAFILYGDATVALPRKALLAQQLAEPLFKPL